MATQLPPLRIFCGYAHADQALFQQLKTALAILIRQEAVSVWHDGDLLPGDQWEYPKWATATLRAFYHQPHILHAVPDILCFEKGRIADMLLSR